MINSVVKIRQSQIEKCVILSVLAQGYMPENKKFGCIVWGQSGCGKNHATDNLHKKFTEMTGKPWGFMDLNCAGMMPEDLTGIPYADKGEAKYLPLIKATKEQFGICRMDEIDRPTGMAVLINATKFAIDHTTVNPLPENWFILGQGNGISDSNTQELTEHIKGRFVHIYVSMNSQLAHEEYMSYMESRNAHPVTLKMARLHPIKTRDEFEEHAVDNGRTREFADCILKAYGEAKAQGQDFSDVLFAVLAGVVGKTLAAEYYTTLELEGLPTLDDVCKAPKTATIPDDLSLRHRLVSILVSEAGDDCAKASKLVEYIVRYPAEVARYALDNLTLTCPNIVKVSAFIQWEARLKK